MSEVSLIRVRFRVAEALLRFLKPAFRVPEFPYDVGSTDTVKHSVESLGIPHTEVGEYRINHQAVSSAAQMSAGDVIEVVAPASGEPLEDPRFVADGHLGRLAAYLRMTGFDCWYEREADDVKLAGVASSEHRLLLTRDVGLLKRREVDRGYCVRSDKPQEQLREVVGRFGLRDRLRPFQRCMDCNGELVPVLKEDVADVIPPHTRATKDVFSRCVGCGKIFWRGSHHARMLGWIEDLCEATRHEGLPPG